MMKLSINKNHKYNQIKKEIDFEKTEQKPYWTIGEIFLVKKFSHTSPKSKIICSLQYDTKNIVHKKTYPNRTYDIPKRKWY